MMMNWTLFHGFLFSVLELKHTPTVYMPECVINQMIRSFLWLLLCKLLFSLFLLVILFVIRGADFALLAKRLHLELPMYYITVLSSVICLA